MKAYVLSHWRGQQSLLWSFLVNTVAGYAIISVASLFFAAAVGASGWHLVARLLVFFAWFAWVVVGTARAGIVTLRDPAASWALKLIALVVLVCLAVGVYAAATDFRILLRWLLGV